MPSAKKIDSLYDHYKLAGSTLWVLSVQYFLVQIVVASAWSNHFSLASNTISDLGNTVCGQYGKMYVCSPLHNWMNTSFVVLGLTQAIGAILLYKSLQKPNYFSLLGFSFMILAGLGTALVGLFPENSVSALHILGASLPFLFGNVGLIVLGLSLKLPKLLGYYTVLSGLLALCALILYLSHNYLGLGNGGMERLTAYPQTIWLIVYGLRGLFWSGDLKRIE